jgi:hypothetical protein
MSLDTWGVPFGRFLISTHYVKYDPKLFFINFAACVFVLFPKLPAVSLPARHSFLSVYKYRMSVGG